MEGKILVAYATKYGSTQEVAEAVAQALREQGQAVDLRRARDVRSLDEYSAVVLGAPLYMFRWHKDALRFLSRHQPALRERPAAVFAMGPWEDKEKDWTEVRSQIEKELAKFPWFSPSVVEVFGGKFDPDKLGFPWNLLPAIKDRPPVDLRDWTAIKGWAESLITRLAEPQDSLE